MKKIFTLTGILFGFLTAQFAPAQSPEKLSYQAVVRNASNELVAEAIVGVRISILKDSESGTVVYMETQTPETNNNGLLSIEIGTGTTTDDFSAIDWSAGPYFLKTEIDPAGATSYSITGTSELISVPYALFAKEAGNSFSGNYNDLTNKPDLTGIVAVGTQPIQGYFQFVTYKSGATNPVAFGFISPDGTIASGSGNFTCSWNATSKRYEIVISGQDYFWTTYTTIVTMASHSDNYGAFAQIGSVGGAMLVYIKK